jgi:hypothetical protein
VGGLGDEAAEISHEVKYKRMGNSEKNTSNKFQKVRK